MRAVLDTYDRRNIENVARRRYIDLQLCPKPAIAYHGQALIAVRKPRNGKKGVRHNTHDIIKENKKKMGRGTGMR